MPLFEDYLIPEPKWSHYDFTFGRNVGSVVNEVVVDILKRADGVSIDDLVKESS